MDLPNTPTKPAEIAAISEKALEDFHNQIMFLEKTASISCVTKLSVKAYGCSLRISWISKANCACHGQLCSHTVCIRETLMKVRDDFSLQALHHSFKAELLFFQAFCP